MLTRYIILIGWQSFFDYSEEDLLNYEYEKEDTHDMDLTSFRERLMQRSGVAIHDVSLKFEINAV